MRRILVDNARRKRCVRHGGELERFGLAAIQVAAPVADEDGLLAVHEALDELAKVDERKAELVKLRFFVGLTFAEAAKVLGISETTAKRDWPSPGRSCIEAVESASLRVNRILPVNDTIGGEISLGWVWANSTHSWKPFSRRRKIADANERAAFVERACSGDATLRQEVESLLQADQGAGDFMKAARVVGPANLNPSEQAGDRIGHFCARFEV